MYYEESMINGVLCWRSTPDGEWTPFTVAELSTRVQRELKTEIAQLKAELAKLQEWQQIILGSGTDKEAVIRMAATKYTEVAVQSWREEVGKLKAELAEARYLRENAESALNTHMEIHARVVNELRAALEEAGT